MTKESDDPKEVLPTAGRDSDPLFTPREAAERLRMSKSSLDKMRCGRDGPPFHAPTKRKIVYRQSDLDAWLAKRRYRSTRDYDDEEDE